MRKAEAGLEAAKLEISRARAGHLPTLDAVASGARTVDFRLDPQVEMPTTIDQLMAQLP